MISKRDLERRMKERQQNNLTQKQIDELEVTKAQVAEHLKTIDFSKHNEHNPTDVEKIAKRVYDFSRILAERKSRVEY
jgi:hypothetical protein